MRRASSRAARGVSLLCVAGDASPVSFRASGASRGIAVVAVEWRCHPECAERVEESRCVGVIPSERSESRNRRPPDREIGFDPPPNDAGRSTPRADFRGMSRTYFVYILANRSRTLYVGVTNDLAMRLAQHREGRPNSFTSRYAVYRLVHVDQASSPRSAIEREKQIKRWSRWKKVALIERTNPDWRDLTEAWVRW